MSKWTYVTDEPNFLVTGDGNICRKNNKVSQWYSTSRDTWINYTYDEFYPYSLDDLLKGFKMDEARYPKTIAKILELKKDELYKEILNEYE